MTLPAGSPVSLGLTLPTGARIKLSPSAAAALLYTPGAASASLVTGLLSTPKVQSITASGAITDSAVSDTGAAAFAYVQGSSVTVGVMALNGRSVPVASVGASGGLAFLPGSDSLLIGDAAANTLTLVQSSSSSPSAQTISAAGLLHSPVAVGVSNSGRWALVANSASQTLVRIDLSSFAAVSLTCNCKPTLSEALADDGAFRVTSLTAGPNWIVDATPATPRLLFIPALPGSTSNKTAVVASVARP
jgi:hypothetical protein